MKQPKNRKELHQNFLILPKNILALNVLGQINNIAAEFTEKNFCLH